MIYRERMNVKCKIIIEMEIGENQIILINLVNKILLMIEIKEKKK